MADPGLYGPKIEQARSAGYSDDEIVSFLSQQDPKFRQAKDAGYSGSEIISHLSGAARPVVAAPIDDHGLARRQAMAPAEKAVSPITEWPRNYEEIRTEAQHQVGRGLGQLGGAFAGASGDLSNPAERARLLEAAKGAANVGLGSLGFVASPFSAAYRSIAGQPIEDVTGIPRELTEFTAQLLTPGLGFTRLPKAPGVAEPLMNIRPPETTMARPDVAEAAQRLQEINPDISVPRTITGGRIAQELGQTTSNIPVIGQPIGEAIHTTLPAQLERTRDIIAAEHGAGTGENVANRIGVTLKEQAATEKAAQEAEAARVNAQATADWQRAQAAREAAIAQREFEATQAEAQTGTTAQRAIGDQLHPQDMGQTVINEVRAAHTAAENTKNALYERAGNINASISDSAIIPMRRDIRMTLERDGIDVGSDATPAARTMMTRLGQFSRDARARAELAPVGQTMQEVEQLRKNLNFLAQGAGNDADRYAARQILNHFDEWQGNAVERHLMPGSDPAAFDVMQAARAANRDWRERFGYNSRDAPEKLINKIVRGEEDQFTGPVGVSNALTAGGDVSGPLYSRILAATGDNPNVAQAIRSGTWSRLVRDAEGAALAPEKVRSNVITHLYGKGRDVAERAFTQEQRDLMRAHADTVVRSEAERAAAEAARKKLPGLAKSTEPKPVKIEPGPMQRLVEDVIGGKTSDEALFRTLHGYAKEGGDVQKLAQVVQQLPQGMRGDLASSFIRELGVAPATKQFSLDHFVNQWNGLSDPAKAVMFGNAGPHVTALNDIAKIAQRLKEVKGRFGNPSGSARSNLFGALTTLLAASVSAPKTALLTAAGAGAYRVAAHVLASPAGASSIARYARAVEKANYRASPTNMAQVRLAQRNVENTARSIAAAQSGSR